MTHIPQSTISKLRKKQNEVNALPYTHVRRVSKQTVRPVEIHQNDDYDEIWKETRIEGGEAYLPFTDLDHQ